MNRRKFFGAMIAPVGAIAAAKYLPASEYTTIRDRFRRWFDADAPPMKIDPQPTIIQTRLHEGGIWSEDMWAEERAKYQHDLTMWLRDKVDEAAFKMMKGDLDGKG